MDESGKSLKATSFDPADLIRDENGELYHLPTLRALYAAGRLAQGSAGFVLLMQHAALHRPRLIA
ncbi:hypothetical protein DEDE109153_09855 [Deinococcus deserti]|uniref:Uncharacterized protein n=1 Tax=Deinococcus deserti (strain DSM 17065 / CIP 109153 / LMG 22923 / VCD115) TaxID=546414 RepID=X5HN04_DEIDV|nr:hypothetical protein [Deinococcus deserti]AHX26487.1 hypothetical protein Deide_04493 [Deinococcus deserti VCD115]